MCAAGLVALLSQCGEAPEKPLTADEIVIRSIDSAGGQAYLENAIAFKFRNRTYRYHREAGQRVYERETQTDSGVITDILQGGAFTRLFDSTAVALPDSLQQRYGNSVNSVHYFAYLPYGLNDAAVNRELLGKVALKGQEYYKVRVTFDQQGGGEDFEDVFVYWFNTQSFNPDYLAYEYHTNGGGLRFREAYNTRRIGGIRFQDYINYKAEVGLPVAGLDSIYGAGGLEELSRIELEEVTVTPGSYN